MVALGCRTVSVALLWLAIVSTANPALAKKDTKASPGEKGSAGERSLDFFGRPRLLDANARGLYVWCDQQQWHVRSATRGARHLFTGTIHVVGGKLTGLANASMEAANPLYNRRHVQDIGAVNTARDTVMFKFITKGAQDGFDLAVDEAATEIEFQILRDGAPIPNEIRIGPNGTRPPGATFSLPARPTQKRAKPEKEKKSKKTPSAPP